MRIDDESIVKNGIAEIPQATADKFGVIKVDAELKNQGFAADANAVGRIVEQIINDQEETKQDFADLETKTSQNFINFKQEVIQNFVNLEYETKQDFANLEEEVKKSIGEQVVKNTNKITAVENALISKGTIAKQEGTLTEERQQTGGADLEGLEVLDGSYATVNKIQGKTVSVDGVLKNAQISGIKSTGRNLLNLNRTKADFDGNSDKTAIRTFDENTYLKGFNENNYWNESNVVSVSIENNKVTINSNNLAYGVGFPIKCLPNTKYTISLNAETVYSKYYVSEFDSNGAYILNKWHSQQSTFTLTTHENCTYMVLVLAGETVNGQKGLVEFSNIMVSQTDTALPYEPYTESVMQLPQMVELGEWDSIENGKVVKQTDVVKITNSTDWVLDDGFYYLIDYRLKAGVVATQAIGTDNSGSFLTNSEVILRAYVQNTYTTLQAWQDRVKELADNGTPLTVAYKLATPIVTDISADFEYQVWDKGQEQMMLENTNAIPTIDNEYIILLGGNE